MKLRLLAAALFVATVVSSASAHAQAVYAQYTGTRLGASGSDTWVTGPTFGAYTENGSALPIHWGLDGRVGLLSKDRTTFNQFLVGPRVALVTHVLPVKIYGEALVGVNHYSLNNYSNNDFSYEFLGGAEFTFFPHLDWRMIEVSTTKMEVQNGQTLHPFGISTGLVLRF
ncbi:hypothetical protein [Terriglobus tenax]|uniref:hypothetical protein n=1 Tax=Terriglobus tenax TaxID=1111115 RepID=UPI0021E06E91|nr:hypothetical protein [Terriglobus tenax]